MRFAFDSEQPHQRAALDAVVDLFRGHPPLAPKVAMVDAPGGGLITAVPNLLTLPDEKLLANLRMVQARSELPLAPGGADSELAEIAEPFADDDSNAGLLAGKTARFPNFSLEMETGTGKTYVYLRTIRELARRYGFRKFVVVVPSIAVREGVLHAMKSTNMHLADLCGIGCENTRYDSSKMGRVSAFARESAPQAMVMTIDSIKREDVLMLRSSEGLIGDTPLHFIQATRPILILDEPQNMETPESRRALARLNPLFALRYSATHKRGYNIVHRLSPTAAYRAGLVKKMVIAGSSAGDTSAAYVRLLSVRSDRPVVPTARLEVNIGTERKKITVLPRDSLEWKSGVSLYEGFRMTDIVRDPPSVELMTPAGIVALNKGEAFGETDKEELFRSQIAATIQAHFNRQTQLRKRGIKVLSLFFIDRVDNYRVKRDRDAPPPERADLPLIRRIFEEEFDRLKSGEWKNIPATAVHNGYFAKSVGGNTEDDAKAYQLIMRDKESLLTFPDPKRDDAETLAKRRVAFIFSHSALREGWDNPNIFQICTLNETRSETRKRQEIGRGVRLAVNQNGDRVLDESVNILTVAANQSYEAYLSEYQGEVESDYGELVRERLGGDWSRLTKEEREWAESYKAEAPPVPARADRQTTRANPAHIRAGRGGMKYSAAFEKLWRRISQRTRYTVNLDSDALVKHATEHLKTMTIPGMEIIREDAMIVVNAAGDFEAHPTGGERTPLTNRAALPDAVEVVNGMLERGALSLRLSRPTVCKIIRADVKRAMNNPYGWSRCAADAVRQALAKTLENGVVYEKADGDFYEWRSACEREFPIVAAHIAKLQGAKNAAYDAVPCDSAVEKKFAEDMAKRRDVKLFLKLPKWFQVPTPVGDYNPDWAILFADDNGGEKLVLVAETKGSVDDDGNVRWDQMRPEESAKIHCAAAHFGSRQLKKKGALDNTDYKVLKSAARLLQH